jgi:acetyl esterase/lipase
MIEKPFRLDTGDHNAGVAYVPAEDSRKRPVLVYCHGWGGNHHLSPPLVHFRDKMVPNGWAVVSFSFYGCGETGGDPSETSYGRWASNLRDILAWVRMQPWANPARVGCWGVSSGTNPCMRVASEDNNPAFVISTATFITYLGYSLLTLAGNIESLCNGGRAETLGVNVPLSFYLDMIRNAPVHRLDKVRCPVFFLTGENDNPFRKADALIGYEQMVNSGLPARQCCMPGGDHGLETVAEAASEKVIEWLKEIRMIAKLQVLS